MNDPHDITAANLQITPAPMPLPPGTHPRGQPGPICRTCVPWLVRHRRPILVSALALSLVGAFFSARLYADLRADVEELLPDNAPSVVAARTVGPKLHAFTNLSVVLEGANPEALERLADDLVARLRKLPPSLVQSIEYRIDEQERFARRFGGFLLSVEDLRTIQTRIDKRIAWEKRKANPLLDLLDEEETEPAPPLDFSDIEKKYGDAGGAFSRFRNGYFQTPDGRILVVMIRPPETTTGQAANERLVEAVQAEVRAVQPSRYDPTVRIGYDGEVASLLEEQQALVADLAASTVVVLVLVLLSLWIYFRRWTAILAISGALGTACALTFGLSFFLVGHLNANTAFLGSIVVGNGINVSIIFLARYLEERRGGASLLDAMQLAWSGTVAATFVAAFGAGLAYLSLSITDFRGFSQFGLIGGVGMAFCWVLAYLLLPPLIAALDKRSAAESATPHRPVLGEAVSRLLRNHSRLVRAVSVLLLLASVAGVLSYRGQVIEYDLSKLRSARSMRSGSVHWGKKADEVFRAYLTPIVIRAETPAELDRVVAALEEERRKMGKEDLLREVRTLKSVVPPDQAEKLPLLRRLRDTLTDSRLAKLDPDLRQKARDLRPPRDLRTFKLPDVPETFRLPLVERDGSAGRVALAFPRKIGTLEPRDLEQITAMIRGAIGRSGARAQAVSQSLLFADIAQAILTDGPKATALAILLVCLLVVTVFRKVRPSVEVAGSLLLGVAWLVGAGAFARVRLNFLNFVVLPITFGIGVDYAVNIVQRYRLAGRSSLDRVLKETGGAVALCSATTVIGYASLLAAQNNALRGFGLLASLGELACLGAALVALPAWMLRRSTRGGTGGARRA